MARKSHPGCKIGLVLDQDTQLEDPSQVPPCSKPAQQPAQRMGCVPRLPPPAARLPEPEPLPTSLRKRCAWSAAPLGAPPAAASERAACTASCLSRLTLGVMAQVDVVHRLKVDKSKFGRNEYNDLYHWAARYSMLEKLTAEGKDRHAPGSCSWPCLRSGSWQAELDRDGVVLRPGPVQPSPAAVAGLRTPAACCGRGIARTCSLRASPACRGPLLRGPCAGAAKPLSWPGAAGSTWCSWTPTCWS